jgi:RHS repeat-associated protein
MNNTGTGQGCWSLYAPSLSVNTYNQITNGHFGYDFSGNILEDGVYMYTWNAESLLASAHNVNYYYDGDNKRVEKSGLTYYWFSPSGTLLAETDASGNTQNEYIFFNGGRTARRDSSGNVYYYFQDQIGTSRLITNSSGTVCYDADYTPFGQELAYTTTCSQNYKFTGMERDTETANDHTWFRGYEWNLGRWMSPDLLGGDVTNPQSLNRYSYVLNNSATLTDPLGLQEDDCSDPAYADSNAECGTPPCETFWEPGCGGPVPPGGGGSELPPTVYYPGNAGSLGGDSFTYNCLSPEELARLRIALLQVAAATLGSTVSSRSPNTTGPNPEQSVIGGAQNVYINTPNSGASAVYIDPSVLGNTSTPDQTYEQGWDHELIVPATSNVPGPGMWVHVIFNTGSANSQGQILVTSAKVHADIGNPLHGFGIWKLRTGLLRHIAFDVIDAANDSNHQGGCPVKIF